MLGTNERTLLLESLRPPEGYELDFAITTTFTLDLISLLIAPLGFTFFELEGDPSANVTSIDPLVLLRTLRRYAERLTVFCQAGRIAVPRMQQPLIAALEGSVVPVKASIEGGVFHPKVWVLRYTSEHDPVHYRLICQTRNLTFDGSWDTSLIMDGKLVDRKVAYAANHPLADFVAELPRLAVDDVSPLIAGNVQLAASELRRVDFQPPEPFENYAFHPLGFGRYTANPIPDNGRTLVISPFLTAGMAREFGSAGSDSVLVSRADTMDALSRSDLSGFAQIYTLEPSAEAELQVETQYAQDSLAPSAGLHAKLFVVEEGRHSTVWSGSANATDAAFHRNVEFLVSLGGKKSVCGISSIFGAPNDQTALRNFLVPYEPRKDPIECDEQLEALERSLDEARLAIAGYTWRAKVKQNQSLFDISLEPGDHEVLNFNTRAAVRIWPITLNDNSAKPLSRAAEPILFGPVTLEALTPFFAVDISLKSGDQAVRTRFVLRARLEGAPADRREHLLNYYLKDPRSLIRFLLLLLTPDDESTDAPADGFSDFYAPSKPIVTGPPPEALLEALLRAMHRNPTSLDSVATAIEDLRKTDNGRKLIPDGFDSIWEAIWATRQKLRPAANSKSQK